VIEHLYALGHRRIAHVTGPQTYTHERRRRRLVREEAAATAGLRVDSVEGDYTLEGGRLLTLRLLRSPEPPTGILFANDLMAIGGLDAAAEAGVAIPARLSLVSWDDSMLCRVARPGVTALDRHPRLFGAMSAKVLLEVIAGRQPGDVVVGPSTLVVRGTSARVPS